MNEKRVIDIRVLQEKLTKIQIVDDYDQIMEKTNNSKVIGLTISDEYSIGADLVAKMTTPDNPIVFANNVFFDNLMAIHPSYYKEYYQDIIDFIKELNCNDICLYQYDESILEAVVSNNNIKMIHLPSLDLDTYNILKKREDLKIQVNSNNTKNIDPSLINIFDGKIFNNITRSLVRYYNYQKLQTLDSIDIVDKLSDEEINYLNRYASNLKTIKLSSEKMIEVINKIDNPNINIELRINQYVPTSVLNELKGRPIFIKYKRFSYEPLSLEEYLSLSRKLDDMVGGIEDIGLSPLEQFLYVFDKAKNYKQYKEADDRNEARNLKYVLDDSKDYIVCVGYANLLMELCHRIGVPCIENPVSLNNIDKNDYNGHHARLMVKLDDDKYGIHGCYQTDPTFSSKVEMDLYPTALMTVSEAHASSLHYYYDDSVIYSSDSYQEFHMRLGKKVEKQEYELKRLLEDMKSLDNLNNTFMELDSYKKFNSLPIYNKEDVFELLHDDKFVIELYHHIKATYQTPISGDILIEAIRNVKQIQNSNLSEEEINVLMDSIINDNIRAYDCYFPPITIEGERAEIFANKENKFEVASQNIINKL